MLLIAASGSVQIGRDGACSIILKPNLSGACDLNCDLRIEIENWQFEILRKKLEIKLKIWRIFGKHLEMIWKFGKKIWKFGNITEIWQKIGNLGESFEFGKNWE